MPYPLFTKVRLIHDAYQHEGLQVGMIGYVIEVHAPGVYEVEFSGANGEALALLSLKEADLEPCPEGM